MATMDALLSQPWPRELNGVDVAICALIYYYVEVMPENDTSPIVAQLLTFTTRLIFRVDVAPQSLQAFKAALEAFLRGTMSKGASQSEETVLSTVNSIVDIVEQVTSFSRLHDFFTRVERLLLREEMFDEVQNRTILPADRQIDESSPFGHYLHMCLESYLCLEDDEFAKLVRRIDAWVKSNVEGTADETETLTAEDDVALALRRGDYATARAAVEGSFDRAPAAMLGRTLPDTLFYNAKFHVETKAYDTAKASLEEALRLARGMNNSDCIAACDDLLRQIAFEQRMMSRRSTLSRSTAHEGRSKLPLLSHKRDAYVYQDAGLPVISIVEAIGQAQAQWRKFHESQRATNTAIDAKELDLLVASLWDALGSEQNSGVIRSSFLADRTSFSGWQARDQDAQLALAQARSFSIVGQHSKALDRLLRSDNFTTMNISQLHSWHAEMIRALYRAAKASGSVSLVRSLIKLRPEVQREVCETYSDGDDEFLQRKSNSRSNEATFLRTERLSQEETLTGKLREARRMRQMGQDPAQSLVMAIEVMNIAGRIDLFVIYRKAVYEAAESLLSIGQRTRAREMLDDILPQVLSGGESSMCAQVAWLYSRILLTDDKADGEDNEKYQQALVWLHRAARGFTAVGRWPEAVEVSYVKARLYHHLGMIVERDESAREHNELLQQKDGAEAKAEALFEDVQTIIGLSSARVVAGG